MLFQESGALHVHNRADFISDYTTAVNGLAQSRPAEPQRKVACYSNFVQGFGPPLFEFRTIDYGFFFQDDWRLGSA